MYQRNQILPQFQNNKKFPTAIGEYITKNKPNEVYGDAFVILADIFISSSFKEVNYYFIKLINHQKGYFRTIYQGII